jgi:putative transcriptional regulator
MTYDIISPHISALAPGSLCNHFLVAMPGVDENIFSKAVIFICEHTDKGAMGIVINLPTSMFLGEVFAQMALTDNANVQDRLVIGGGPVQRERGFVLHSPDAKFTSTLEVSRDICLTASRDVIEAIAEGEGPKKFLVALGYSGWHAGQLEQEIAQNLWLTVPANTDLIFNAALEDRWALAGRDLGVTMSLLPSMAGHA